MEWSDEGIVLAVRALGESSLIVSLLTSSHGRHSGLVHGGASRRRRGVLQPGNRVQARWRARLADQLGTMTCEPAQVLAPGVLGDRARLAAIAAACAVAETALPEREPAATIYDSLSALLAAVEADAGWSADFVRWELGLLAELGFGLDLGCCAVTGVTANLVYVSPRSGRAVSAVAGWPWRDRLLRLPEFLVASAAPAPREDIADGLALTGHFLLRHVYAEQCRALPPARTRLTDEIGRGARVGGNARG